MQMKSFFTIYKFQFLKNLNSWNIKVNLLFNFFCMLLLIFVSAVEKELASETFTFFLLFIYIPSQLFFYSVGLDDLFSRSFIERYKWLFSYNASKIYIYLGCLLSYLTSLLVVQIFLLIIFMMMLNLFAIQDLLILSVLKVIFLVAAMQLFLFLIICYLNSILNTNKLIKYLISLLIFITALIYLFNIFDSLSNLFLSNLSEYIRGNQNGISNTQIIQSSTVFVGGSLVLIFANYVSTLKFY